jgi:hypothetical protein
VVEEAASLVEELATPLVDADAEVWEAGPFLEPRPKHMAKNKTETKRTPAITITLFC